MSFLQRRTMLQFASNCITFFRNYTQDFEMSAPIRISDNLVNEAKIRSKVENRSLTGQIEYWAKIGKIAEENPDMPYTLLKEILIGMAQLDSGQGTEYRFG
jgi:hypothetical protein